MGYEELWRALGDLVTELRRVGELIPAEVIRDLRSAKTMMQILKAGPGREEGLQRVETYLGSVESYLIPAAESRLGPEETNRWMRRLREARSWIHEKEETAAPPRFVPGLPRDRRWLRIQVTEETPRRDIERLAGESGLSCKAQEGFMLVYGGEEGIRSFVRRVAERLRGPERR